MQCLRQEIYQKNSIEGLVKGPGGARGLSAGQPVCTTPSSQMLKILWKSGAKHSANKPS